VHHRTIKINHQPDATIFQFIILTFVYSSSCLGRFPAHYQELNDCSGSVWFYLRIVVTVVLCSWSGRPRTHHDYHQDTKVKPEAATAVIELLMMGGKTPETCWAVNERQDNKLKNCCIRLVIYLNCTMMHGLINLNPLNPELNPICYLLALLGAHHFLHVSRIRVKSLTFRRLMAYIYGAPILDVSRSHTTTHHSR